MESNEGKWASDEKTVWKIIELTPGSSRQIPWLWKLQNYPPVSVTILISALLVPVLPRAEDFNSHENRANQRYVSRLPHVFFFFKWNGRIFCENFNCWFSFLDRGWIPLLLPCVIWVTPPLSFLRLFPACSRFVYGPAQVPRLHFASFIQLLIYFFNNYLPILWYVLEREQERTNKHEPCLWGHI